MSIAALFRIEFHAIHYCILVPLFEVRRHVQMHVLRVVICHDNLIRGGHRPAVVALRPQSLLVRLVVEVCVKETILLFYIVFLIN